MKKLAVIGHPISHSRSPVMQNAALADAGLSDEWHYEAIDIEPEELPQRLVDFANGGEYAGLNVTVPHKEGALAAATSASDAAREIGAANTLIFNEAGEIHAENTDAPGLLDAIATPVAGMRALVLGAGGAARAVVWALFRAEAEVTIWARRPEAADALAAEFGSSAWRVGASARDFDLIVNASSAGLGDGRALVHLPLEAEDLRRDQVVVDMVYGQVENDLTVAARNVGCRVVDGLEILARQGALSFEIWTGRRPSLEVMRQALRRPVP